MASPWSTPAERRRWPGGTPLIRARPAGTGADWVRRHRDTLCASVTGYGSILVRGLELRDAAHVATVAAALGGHLMAEREAFASRKPYPGGIYSSTPWPARQPMSMHHELSYSLDVPGLLLFACLTAPTHGGATGVADSATVLRALPARLVQRFEEEGWLLTRNYGCRMGASPSDAFSTDNPRGVESYCRANAIELEWQPGGGLRTRQRRPAVVTHPSTGRRCWFNQIAFFNEWAIDPEARELLVDLHGADRLPFNTYFGNGDPISKDIVRLVEHAYRDNTARVSWRAGDLLLIDNIATAHDREAFVGPREVLVGMVDPVRLDAR